MAASPPFYVNISFSDSFVHCIRKIGVFASLISTKFGTTRPLLLLYGLGHSLTLAKYCPEVQPFYRAILFKAVKIFTVTDSFKRELHKTTIGRRSTVIRTPLGEFTDAPQTL